MLAEYVSTKSLIEHEFVDLNGKLTWKFNFSYECNFEIISDVVVGSKFK